MPPLRRAISLLATTALLGACAGAQAPPPSDGKPGPFLYRIDGAVPSHLFGTIHLPDERVLELPSSVERALDDADAVYTEVKLAGDWLSVAGSNAVDSNLSEFDEPTLGVVRGDDFYFVANSHWNRFDAENYLPDGLSGPIILKIALRN